MSDDLIQTLEEAADEIASLRALLKQAMEALEPIVDFVKDFDTCPDYIDRENWLPPHDRDYQSIYYSEIRTKQLRTLRTAYDAIREKIGDGE